MKTKLITKKGFKKLEKELEQLWLKERPIITEKVSWAASLGDRSENADYKYNKQKLREIDRRIRFLRKTLEDIKVVEYHAQQEGRVFFGAWVELEDDEGMIIKFRIVGPEEIYGRNDYISVDSPMARACLKKVVNDEVEVKIPAGIKRWSVRGITYREE